MSTMDIGKEVKEVEFAPLTAPAVVPSEPTPVTPAEEPVQAPVEEPVPA